MDPQSVSFQPQSDNWRVRDELQRLQAVQAEHTERISRIERRVEDDARMKSVWGGASPFPGVLSGTPQQTPLQQPNAEAFKTFDDESTNLIGSLHLDAEDEPRRIGATSRANSVRFDESANQGHWSHTSRSSMDLMRSTGGIPMGERTASHKSEGRASSVHSVRSAASGRANSLNLESGYSFGDSARSPMEYPGLAPGLLLLGSVPAIIRCWMNTTFKHDALYYAAICSGSHKSLIDRRLVDALGYSGRITTSQTVVLPVYFPEAVPHPASSRSSSPAPQLPTLTVTFTLLPTPAGEISSSKTIQIIIGSDVLRLHSADILFSTNSMSIFDDERNKISIPLVRPEDQRTFSGLYTASDESHLALTSRRSRQDLTEPALNGLGQSKPPSVESMPSLVTGMPIGSQRPSVATPQMTEAARAEVSCSSDDDINIPTGRSIRFAQDVSSAPSPRLDPEEVTDDSSLPETHARTNSSPAIWSNWRQRGPETPTNTTAMDYANASKGREAAPLRKESGMKVLRPMKSASRTASASSSSTTYQQPPDGRSRFFDDGKRRATLDSAAIEQKSSAGMPSEDEVKNAAARPGHARVNPAGGASAFSWMKQALFYLVINAQTKKRHSAHWPVSQGHQDHHQPLATPKFREPPYLLFKSTSYNNILRFSISKLPKLPLRWQSGGKDKAIQAEYSSHTRHLTCIVVPRALLSDTAELPHPGGSQAATTASTVKKRKITPSGLTYKERRGQVPSSDIGVLADGDKHRYRTASPAVSSSPTVDLSTTSRGNTPSSPGRDTPSLRSNQSALGTESFLAGLVLAAADGETEAAVTSNMSTSGDADDMQQGQQKEQSPLSAAGDLTTTTARRLTGDNVGKRSASPAKRSAAVMEGQEDVEERYEGGIGSPRDTVMNDAATSDAMDGTEDAAGHREDDDAELDERVSKILGLLNTSLQKGEAGYLVSYKWLSRVYARSSRIPKSRDFPVEAVQGRIGVIDNSDIAADGGFQGPFLKYEHTSAAFVPIRSNLQAGIDFEVLPEPAWKYISEWYGVKDGQLPVIRYATDTAPEGAAQQNIQYEHYPPVFTVRKMLSAGSQHRRPLSPPKTNTSSQTNTGNTTPESGPSSHAIRILASQQDRWQSFLTRCKNAAGISMSHKVRPWRVLKPSVPPNDVEGARMAILTPAASRSNSPSAPTGIGRPLPSLAITKSEFDSLPEGQDIEMIDAADETANTKYNGKVTIGTLGLVEDQTLILEEQLRGPAGGEYSSDATRRKQKTADSNTATTNGTSPSQKAATMTTRSHVRGGAGRPRGKVGLTNLGNTCYMNSALQCISRIEELADYFLANQWKEEINTDNPLGYNGRMAKAYAEFLSSLYAVGANGAYTPRAFKGALSQAQPMFSGYGQQDSQEFLSFLVDALHEDLNRIHKKPYRENPDSDDNRVHDPQYIRELGDIYRDNHRARNDSIAMDLFNGFYKNTMVCPECDKISVTFDPYSLVTLQLPIDTPWQHGVIFVPNSGRPIRYVVDLPKHSSIRALKQYLAGKRVGETRAENLIVADQFQHKLYRIFSDGEPVSEIGTSDTIFVYELPNTFTNATKKPKKQSVYRSLLSPREDEAEVFDMESPLADRMAVTVFLRHSQYAGGSVSLGYAPFIIMVTREEAKDYDIIFKKLLLGVAKYTSRDFLAEDDTFGHSRGAASRRDSDNESVGQSDPDPSAEAKQSDTSLPSEDEYVNVSMADGSSPNGSSADVSSLIRPGTSIPAAFLNLFEVRYFVPSDGDLQCAGTNVQPDGPLMSERVSTKLHRRSSTVSVRSMNSRSSDETVESQHSTTSSTTEGDDDSTTLMNRASSSLPLSDTQSDEDDPTIMQPSEILDTRVRQGRRGRNPRTYSRRGQNGGRHFRSKRTEKFSKQQNAKYHAQQPRYSTPAVAEANAEDDPYYIKLGEGIVLDWTPEAWDALFGANARDSTSDLRGYPTADEKLVQQADDPELSATLEKRKRRHKEGVSLDECFAETAKTETLSEENAWYCGRCKELRRADKTLMIWTAPDVLVVHLKRFSGERYRRDKVDVLVDFPLEGLDLANRVGMREDGKEYVYDLFAVDNHYGGLGGGHYTAYAKNFFDGKWYDFNDSFVSQQDGRSVVTTAAYLLFYRRRSSTPLGPPYLRELVEKSRNPQPAGSDSETELSSMPAGRTLGGTANGTSRLLLPGASKIDDAEDANDDEGVVMDYDPTPSRDAPIGKYNGKVMHGPVRPSARDGESSTVANGQDDAVGRGAINYASAGTGSTWTFAALKDRDADGDLDLDRGAGGGGDVDSTFGSPGGSVRDHNEDDDDIWNETVAVESEDGN